MVTIINKYILFIMMVGWTSVLFAAPAPEDSYPPAPGGITWGWQTDVLFPFDSSVISKQYKTELNQLIATLKQNPEISVLITGRADNQGNVDYNRKLSARRVKAISTYLTKAGIASRRVATQSVGEQRPVTNNACAEDRERNRSATLAFFPTGYEYTIETPESVREESQPQAGEGECEELKEKLRPKSEGVWQ